MRVEGNTDSDGGVAYNLALSRRRASAVVHDLVARYGIAVRRLQAAGYGLSRPVASNSTEAGKALNPRVELRSALARRAHGAALLSRQAGSLGDNGMFTARPTTIIG